MQQYEFTLKFTLPINESHGQNFIESLADAGCDDAIVGTGQRGRIALHFTRAADNAFESVTSAIHDVKHAIPDARLIEATPDFVGLSDVAELIGFSRQNLRKLMISHSETFPIPMHSGTVSIWHLFDVLLWLEQQQKRVIDSAVKDVALANMKINVLKQAAFLDIHLKTPVE